MSIIARLAALACTAGSSAAFICLSTVARADVTYVYNGAGMTGTESGDIGYHFDYEVVPYGTALFGSFTLSAPLAPNLVDASIRPLTMTFEIGGQNPGGVLYPGNPGLQYQPAQYIAADDPPPNTVLLADTFEFSTNSSGAIIGWDLSLLAPQPYLEPGRATVTSAGDTESFANGDQDGPFYSVANNVAGSWTETTNEAPEIDPATAGSGLTVLAGMMAIVRGRKRGAGLRRPMGAC